MRKEKEKEKGMVRYYISRPLIWRFDVIWQEDARKIGNWASLGLH